MADINSIIDLQAHNVIHKLNERQGTTMEYIIQIMGLLHRPLLASQIMECLTVSSMCNIMDILVNSTKTIPIVDIQFQKTAEGGMMVATIMDPPMEEMMIDDP